MSLWTLWYRLTSPKGFTYFATACIPWLALGCLLTLAYGLVAGLYVAPADYQQEDAFRIIYVHVPCAFVSLLIYSALTVAAITCLVWRVKLANTFVDAAAPVGAALTLLALVTGSLWGKPMWGTWWIWDARLTSELLLLFIYCGIMALKNAFPDKRQGSVFKNAFVVIGSVNLPIIHYSVAWWNTLHQGSTFTLLGPSKIAPVMSQPLTVMLVAFSLYAALMVLLNMRNAVLLECQRARWVSAWLAKRKR